MQAVSDPDLRPVPARAGHPAVRLEESIDAGMPERLAGRSADEREGHQ